MIYYHVTDYLVYERILQEGLLGNPVIYVTHSKESALAIRQCQISLREKFGGCVVLKIKYDGDVFVDPDTWPLNTAWMIYDDIPPHQIQVCWD
jgi:hypothetical protein